MSSTAPQGGKSQTPGREPRILIADDDPQGVELLEAYLSDSDFEVRTTTDGDQTLAQVHEWQPDVILLDVMMPKISGFEVCKRLRHPRHTGHGRAHDHGPGPTKRSGSSSRSRRR